MAKLFTLNVKGLNSNVKRRLLLTELRSAHADIVFLQETHFNKEGNFAFAKSLYPTAYVASTDRKKAGVAILIADSCPFQLISSFSDPNGRFIILQGTLRDVSLTLCNVYAPNSAQIQFLSKVLARLSRLPSTALVIGGDFNLIFSESRDRLALGTQSIPPALRNLARNFRKLIRKYALFDLWRIAHPNERQFSFYSTPHQSHSRIDGFFGNILTYRMLESAEIGPITWSDHAPVTLALSGGSRPLRRCHWRLNERLLKQPDLRDALLKRIEEYFIDNGGSVSSPAILWEAHKAVIRGHCISMSTRLKRDANKLRVEYAAKLRVLESSLSSKPTVSTLRKIVDLRAKLRALSLQKTEKLLLYTRQRYYERGNRAHTLLAKQLREDRERHTPHSLRNSRGEIVYDPEVISQMFHEYFSKLYSLPSSLPPNPAVRHDRIARFLSSCRLPTLPSDALTALNAPITLDELDDTIKALPTGKAPGPDGLTYLYYKTFTSQLAPHMVPLFNAFLEGHSIPSSMSHSYITLVPKTGKDLLDCSNYRPIALLNSDLKIYTKILANRLMYWIPQLIHKDQVGFVPCRQGGDNTRRTIDLVEVINKLRTPSLLLSLDAEKAFDRLSWPFMMETMTAFGFTGSFLQAIQGLYGTPSASIKLPHVTSPLIRIRNGTRQGCPLSPLLFILCIEPLAAAIRLHPDIAGVQVHNKEFKLSLFADDVLLTLTNLHITLPNLQVLLQSFGSLSGYKVNSHKTEALPIHVPPDLLSSLKANYQYHWRDSSIRYLGINITTSYPSLYAANFPKLYSDLRKSLQNWNKLPLSLLGRIAAVKMSLLPKLIYFFETLPIAVPMNDLKALQADVIRFIWAHRRHRIPKSVVLAGKDRGGLAAPDLLKYYWATQLRRIAAWSTLYAYTRWMEIEKLWIAPIHPNAFLWTSPYVPTNVALLGPMLMTKNVWNKCARRFGLCSRASAMTSFLFHPALPESMTASFRPWFERGLFRFVDIVDYKTRKIFSFESLRSSFGLPKESYYSYVQICSYIQKTLSSAVVSLPTAFERLCKAGPSTKGLISDIYRMLLDPDPDTPPRHSYMDKWDAHFSRPLPMETWKRIWNLASKTSLCVTHRENQLKILMHWYHTPTLLHRLNPDIPEVCWRCTRSRGTQFHLFWECPEIEPFWGVVQTLLFDVLGIRFTLDPLLFLLNVSERPLPKLTTKLLIHILTAARCLIALFWKRQAPPSLLDLLARVKEIRTMEYITAVAHNKVDLFHSIWASWDVYSAEHDS